MFYVYLLESESSGRFYIGQTNDIKDRLSYHNSGRSVYTKNRGPWKLLAYKTFNSRGEAMKYERYLKRLKNREKVLREFGLG